MATAKTPAEQIATDLQEELKALRADLTLLAGSVKELAVERAGAVTAKVHDAAEYMTETLKMSAEEARRRGEEVASEVEAAIARHPLTSVGIALGVGYLLAALTRR